MRSLTASLCVSLSLAVAPAFAQGPQSARPAAPAAPAAPTAQPAPPAPATPTTPTTPAEVRLALPKPKVSGSVSVEAALATRRALRSFADRPVSLAQVSQLCWAAQGITDARGHRTAPSALAVYPLELLVLAGRVEGLAPGLYHYVPQGHALVRKAEGDRRALFVAQAVKQAGLEQAPVLFVVTGVPGRFTRGAERALQWVWTETGLVAQSFFLEAVALGLGSNFIGGFDPTASARFLELPEGQMVTAVLPVGYAAASPKR